MGKVAGLRNKVEPFAALFWGLTIVFSGPARHHSTVEHKAGGSIAPPPPLFLPRYVMYLSSVLNIRYT